LFIKGGLDILEKRRGFLKEAKMDKAGKKGGRRDEDEKQEDGFLFNPTFVGCFNLGQRGFCE
jgi:hypothetical protein